MDISTVVPHRISDEELGQRIGQHILHQMREEDQTPLTVCIVGQTGVGKSSLLNALFNCNFAVNNVEPQTKKPEGVRYRTPSGRQFVFYDLPGIGESVKADEAYIKMYADAIRNADVVLWSFHCDSRSVSFDRTGLERILQIGCSSEEEIRVFLSKLVMVLTKADQICPKPWIFALRGSQRHLFSNRYGDRAPGLFVPDEETRIILQQKESYFFDRFLRPLNSLITLRTYNDTNLRINDGVLFCDEYHVRHQGLVDDQREQELVSAHPEHVGLFQRLRRNSSVVSCSALYRYNLHRLMAVVLSRTEISAAGRISGFIDCGSWATMPLSNAKALASFSIFDPASQRWVFDLKRERL